MHDHLLQQARRLARLDPNKPRQANLRRAVSAAYYSLFHFLIDQACRQSLGASHDSVPFRQTLGRAFEHGAMRNACASYGGGTLKANVAKGLPTSFAVAIEIRTISEVFVDVHEIRHLADYDLTERFRRSDVLALFQQVTDAIEQFKRLVASNEKKFFLACLWAWKTLSNR